MANNGAGKKKHSWKDVERLTGVSKSTLVRWEQKGCIPQPKRRASNRARMFDDEYISRAKEYNEKVVEPPSPPKPIKRR